MPRLAATATAVPPHVVLQTDAIRAVEKAYAGHDDLLKLLRVFARAGVERRHFAFPPEYYLEGRGFEERNRDFIEQGAALAEKAARECLDRAGVKPAQVDYLFLVTTTGLATPSLDALLAPRLGLRKDVRRSPLFGLGCAGGAAALSRAADVLKGHPRQRALAVSVEICGQVFTPRALTPTDVIGAALFGDGAAAALVVGDQEPAAGPRIASTRSVLFDEARHLMGWDFTADGMRLRLSQDVTAFIHERLKPAVEEFLGGARIRHWMLHPGGRKVIETYAEVFGLADADLDWTRGSLARFGNLSSASVLFILSDVLERAGARAGEKGLMCALGPGFASELLILEW